MRGFDGNANKTGGIEARVRRARHGKKRSQLGPVQNGRSSAQRLSYTTKFSG